MSVPTLDQMIADAQTALHRLQIGQSAVRVKTADQDIEFKPADVNKLQEYLDGLLQQQATGTCRPSRGAIGFVFSIALALLTVFASAPSHAAAKDGGPDLPWPCWIVKLYAAHYSQAELEAMAKQHGVVLSPKQRRQAEACLK